MKWPGFTILLSIERIERTLGETHDSMNKRALTQSRERCEQKGEEKRENQKLE